MIIMRVILYARLGARSRIDQFRYKEFATYRPLLIFLTGLSRRKRCIALIGVYW